MASQVDLDACFNVAVELARQAGEVIRNAIGEKKHAETKQSAVDLVTETDKRVEKLLFDGFKAIFVDHKFIGEESTADGNKCELTDAPTWIIDPVDGTMNFVHSFPYACVSIGLAVNKEVILGVVYNPVLEQMYTGVKGRGAYCNGKQIKVSGEEDLSKGLIFLEIGSSRDENIMNNVFENYRTLAYKVHSIRSMGSAALNMCSVASGFGEAYFEYTIHCWDIAAGKVIVEEAGGIVTDPDGGPLDIMSRRVLCASTSKLAQSLSEELKHIQVERD